MTKHDVVIIGGSLAGAACARELARLGIDAIAFERDRFPRAKVCGGFLSPGGVEYLVRLGVLHDVRAAGAVEVSSAKVRMGSAEIDIPFERPGLGISRSALDQIVARAVVHQGCAVSRVARTDGRFVVSGLDFEVSCSVVVDAAGKLSRFTRRREEEEFGIQYSEDGTRGDVLDFWFFEDGYGGAVSVEGGRSNFCFLISKDKLPRYVGRPGCLVTGPLAYDRLPGDYIAVGDAAGMVDPFCGEGMRHALDSGMLAARVVARGIRARRGYEEMRREYESEWNARWGWKRALGAGMRKALKHRKIARTALRFVPARLLNRLWD
jgi:flavin-dependent dehydrogenase